MIDFIDDKNYIEEQPVKLNRINSSIKYNAEIQRLAIGKSKISDLENIQMQILSIIDKSKLEEISAYKLRSNLYQVTSLLEQCKELT